MANGFKTCIGSVWECVDSVIFGSILTLRSANKKVRQKIDNVTEDKLNDDPRLDCAKGNLEDEFATSIKRLEKIENKAMHTLLGVTVAIAVLGATFGIFGPQGVLGNKSFIIRIALAVLMIFTVIYFLLSGLLALHAYEIGKVYRPRLHDRAPLVDERQEKIIILYCLEKNRLLAIIRSNRLSASFSCLRNGIIVLIVSVVVIAVALTGII